MQVLDLLLLEVVAGHLHPHPVLVLRLLVDTSLGHLELAVLLGQPEVDVVELVLAAVLSEVGAGEVAASLDPAQRPVEDRKSTRLNSSHVKISYAVFCLKK